MLLFALAFSLFTLTSRAENFPPPLPSEVPGSGASALPGLKLYMGQIRIRAGDVLHNFENAARAYQEGVERVSDVVVLPEGIFPGYPSNDVLNNPDFIERALKARDTLCQLTQGKNTVLIFGNVEPTDTNVDFRKPWARGMGRGRHLQNVVSVCRDGVRIHRQAKILLPTYGPFDDKRWFEEGSLSEIRPIEINGARVVIGICEDLWYHDRSNGRLLYKKNTINRISSLKPDVVISVSASPWHQGKPAHREDVHADVARRVNAPLVYVNQVGAVDHLNFDGNSFVVNAQGELDFRLNPFAADGEQVLVPFSKKARALPARFVRSRIQASRGDLLQSLESQKSHLREFLHHIGHDAVVFGLSGGLDSAMAAAKSALALGPDKVFVIMMPSEVSSQGSVSDSRALIENLGIPDENVLILPIQEIVDAFLHVLESQGVERGQLMSFRAGEVAVENIQARTRMILEYFVSNLTGPQLDQDLVERLSAASPRWKKFFAVRAVKLATGDKSEAAVGNGTLLGDMSGAFAINGDRWKTEMWWEGALINETSGRELIPLAILNKDPTPELLSGQLTTDLHVPYPLADPISQDYFVRGLPLEQIRERYALWDYVLPNKYRTPTVVDYLVRQYVANEFKRELVQIPVARTSAGAFGKERRVTISVVQHTEDFAGRLAACMDNLEK